MSETPALPFELAVVATAMEAAGLAVTTGRVDYLSHKGCLLVIGTGPRALATTVRRTVGGADVYTIGERVYAVAPARSNDDWYFGVKREGAIEYVLNESEPHDTTDETRARVALRSTVARHSRRWIPSDWATTLTFVRHHRRVADLDKLSAAQLRLLTFRALLVDIEQRRIWHKNP